MTICFRCKKDINENNNYYSFTEFREGKIKKVDYSHITCWENFLNQVGNVDEAMGMLRGIKGPLIKMGILKPEEVVIP